MVVGETIHAGVVKRRGSAFEGDAVRARTLVDDLANRFPDHTIVQAYDVPTIRAQLAYELSGSGALCGALLDRTLPYRTTENPLFRAGFCVC